jgi:LPS sulfotransferase NodH
MSIGRCGSTLLNRLLAVDGSLTVSEPDVFSQVAGLTGIASQSGRPEHQVCDDAKAVLRATLQSLRTWAHVPPDRLVIKLRSQANEAVEQIVAAFPQARFVFVFRDSLEGWVRSFVRAFGHTAPTLVHTLASGVRACEFLRTRGVDLSVISYEMLTTDPAAIVQRVRGKDDILTESQKAMVETVLSRDSQSGTSISRASRRERESASCGLEQQTWAEFHALWRETRPAATISALQLPY